MLGLLVGSFLNVVVHRLPQMLERGWAEQCAELRGETLPPAPRYNLVVPRSACPSCGHAIRALENVPVLLVARAARALPRLRHAISLRYPLVELARGHPRRAGDLALRRHGWQGAAACLLLWVLIALRSSTSTRSCCPTTSRCRCCGPGCSSTSAASSCRLSEAVVGAMAGYLSLWSVYWAFKLIPGKEGMGYGDFKLLAALGAWLGWKLLPAIVLLSSVVGAVVGIALILFRRHEQRDPIPFGPYLAAAGAIALFAGKPLASFYLP